MNSLDEHFSDPWPLAGAFTRERINSVALQSNALGDAHERTAYVYTPPGYDDDPTRHYPAIYFLHGYLGRVDGLWNWVGFQPSVPQYIDECFADPSAEPAIVVLVDAWTKIGGSQYLNSPATGRYLDYLADDVVSSIDERYRTIPDRDHRGVSGKSSGGYGAMVATMLRPDVFGAFASHSGDCGFEQCYLFDISACARALRDLYGGSWQRFFDDFFSRPAKILNATDPDHVLINIYAMAAAYSPEEDGSVSLPFDTKLDVLRSLRGIWIDAGRRDDYYLDLGAQAISSQLDAAAITHRFELFEGFHAGVQHRYPLGFRYLAERLASAGT
jgi:hypothetical protein